MVATMATMSSLRRSCRSRRLLQLARSRRKAITLKRYGTKDVLHAAVPVADKQRPCHADRAFPALWLQLIEQKEKELME